MARKSIDDLILQAQTTIEDNVTKNISAADVRTMFINFLQAIAPAYAYCSIGVTPHVQTVNVAPSLLTYTDAKASYPTDANADAALGTINRLEHGTNRITFSADLELAANRECVFTLYKDGQPTSWNIKGSGSGSGRPASVNMVALDYATAAAAYTIRVSADADGTSVSFNNSVFLAEVVPVRSFT
jgi:hypothetical protein